MSSLSESLLMRQVPSPLFQSSPVAHMDAHSFPPTYILSHTHRHIHMHTVTNVSKEHLEIFPDAVLLHELLLYLISLFGKTLLIS